VRKSDIAENPHFRELLQLLNDFDVRYLIVGGYAIIPIGEEKWLAEWVEERIGKT
jgi:hypothetical protein